MFLFSEHSILLLLTKVTLKALKTNRAAYTATDQDMFRPLSYQENFVASS